MAKSAVDFDRTFIFCRVKSDTDHKNEIKNSNVIKMI